MPTKLGQNFLRDEKVLKKIIDSANLSTDDLVIEIGPGGGLLTEALAKKCKKIVAIEIDGSLCTLLRNRFSNKKNVEIINANILKIDLRQLISNFQIPISNKIPGSKFQIPNFPYKVIANLPYYITSPIIRLFLESEFPPQEMILMVQKEVAERIIAKPGQMSVLAVSVQYYAAAELLFAVSKNSFFPVPEVDSAVIRITRNPEPVARSSEEVKKFFRVVRAVFSAKRKTLVNNLSSSFHLNKKEVEEKIKKIGLNPKVRAQELSVEEWKKLTKLFG